MAATGASHPNRKAAFACHFIIAEPTMDEEVLYWLHRGDSLKAVSRALPSIVKQATATGPEAVLSGVKNLLNSKETICVELESILLQSNAVKAAVALVRSNEDAQSFVTAALQCDVPAMQRLILQKVVASKNPLLGTCFCTRLMTCQQAPWKHCRDKLLHLLPHDEIRRAINECQHRLYYISWKYLAVQNPGLALEFLCNFIKDASDQASLQHRWRKVGPAIQQLLQRQLFVTEILELIRSHPLKESLFPPSLHRHLHHLLPTTSSLGTDEGKRQMALFRDILFRPGASSLLGSQAVDLPLFSSRQALKKLTTIGDILEEFAAEVARKNQIDLRIFLENFKGQNSIRSHLLECAISSSDLIGGWEDSPASVRDIPKFLTPIARDKLAKQLQSRLASDTRFSEGGWSAHVANLQRFRHFPDVYLDLMSMCDHTDAEIRSRGHCNLIACAAHAKAEGTLLLKVLKFVAKRLENERKSTTISAFDEVGKLSWDCIEAQHLPWLEKIAIDADLQISGGRNLMDIVATSVLFSRLDKLPIAEWNADQLISWVLANHERFGLLPERLDDMATKLHHLGQEKVLAVLDRAIPWTEELYSGGKTSLAVACLMALSIGSGQYGWLHQAFQAALEKKHSQDRHLRLIQGVEINRMMQAAHVRLDLSQHGRTPAVEEPFLKKYAMAALFSNPATFQQHLLRIFRDSTAFFADKRGKLKIHDSVESSLPIPALLPQYTLGPLLHSKLAVALGNSGSFPCIDILLDICEDKGLIPCQTGYFRYCTAAWADNELTALGQTSQLHPGCWLPRQQSRFHKLCLSLANGFLSAAKVDENTATEDLVICGELCKALSRLPCTKASNFAALLQKACPEKRFTFQLAILSNLRSFDKPESILPLLAGWAREQKKPPVCMSTPNEAQDSAGLQVEEDLGTEDSEGKVAESADVPNSTRSNKALIGAIIVSLAKRSRVSEAVKLLKDCLDDPSLKLTLRKQILRVFVLYPSQQGDKILSKILAEFESMHRSLKIALVNALYEAIESGAHRPCDTFFKTVRLCSLATDQETADICAAVLRRWRFGEQDPDTDLKMLAATLADGEQHKGITQYRLLSALSELGNISHFLHHRTTSFAAKAIWRTLAQERVGGLVKLGKTVLLSCCGSAAGQHAILDLLSGLAARTQEESLDFNNGRDCSCRQCLLYLCRSLVIRAQERNPERGAPRPNQEWTSLSEILKSTWKQWEASCHQLMRAHGGTYVSMRLATLTGGNKRLLEECRLLLSTPKIGLKGTAVQFGANKVFDFSSANDLCIEFRELAAEPVPQCRALAANLLRKSILLSRRKHTYGWAFDIINKLRGDENSEVVEEAWSQFCYEEYREGSDQV